MKKVRDFMTRNVITCSPEDTIFDVAKKLSENAISGMPVVDKGKLVGIISVSDIVKFMKNEIKNEDLIPEEPHSIPFILMKMIQNELKIKKELEKISKIKVKHVMSKKVITISPDASLADAAELLVKKRITRVPVIENGKIVGILTKSDLVKALVEI
ncbi:MAG: CBS domain-containing protein [Candidatus Aenigmarchaeota archaeon ex4484_224]|nr:MAG: CBS domain-containing protein [Candidatus Aenigmarchaeota archaeon ex4484_224]